MDNYEELDPKLKNDKPPEASQEEIDAERMPEPPLQPPSSGRTGGFMSRFSSGGGGEGGGSIVKIGAVALAVSVLVSFILLPLFGLGSYLTKKDFEANIAGMTATIETLSADIDNSVAEMKAAQNDIAHIPSSIQSQLNQILPQEMKEYQTDINALNDQINGFATKINKVDADLAKIIQSNSNLQTQVTELEAELNVTNDKVSELENQLEESDSSDNDNQDIDDDDVDVYVDVYNPGKFPQGVDDNVTRAWIEVVIYNDSGVNIDNMDVDVAFRIEGIESGTQPSLYPISDKSRWVIASGAYGYESNLFILRGSRIDVDGDEKRITIYIDSYADSDIESGLTRLYITAVSYNL